MSSIVVVGEERTPLLQSSLSHDPSGDSVAVDDHDMIPTSSSNDRGRLSPTTNDHNQRLFSLDVFRGLTVALMILVDDAGGAFPSINHSPWFGVTLADFVVPSFLFGVGVSISLVFKKHSDKPIATKKVILRSAKLFVLGVVLQGGYFHGRNHLSYGVDIDCIRWLGVLQRISIGYLLAAISEIWLVSNVVVDTTIGFVKKYYIQWIVSISLCFLYMGLLYGLYVPDWEFEVPSINSSSAPNYGSGNQIVHCGVRGSLGPPCNAAGLIDRFFLGEKHLYQHPVYRRTKECSIKSPDYGPLPPNSPGWCLAPFDPEGILSSLMAAVTCFIGLHYGHIIVDFKRHTQRVFLWSMSSMLLLLSGYVMVVLGIPLSKPLYTLSYMCITTGASGILLTIVYYIVDAQKFRKPTTLLEWMGMNAFIVYALAACELFPAAIQGFYWRSPENNLVNGTEVLLQTMLQSMKWGTLVFVLLEILFWCLVAGFLHMKRIYIKL
ncbi:heparan-alpha-glucosaminide N-acetyltransferase-like isoform X1 [Macadamia integrifolia]|uniref:heparan-alpha-glucosaminide N-acetyltransferase-like isoform X1 n=2 Tax=Macadamia integrifolia TaxID=60698 RepID=UPI001C4F229B|nr:heparan-alpha-glucosaminide N-acetyltransferase-like isoform X1 [Macadamia integrifolia]